MENIQTDKSVGILTFHRTCNAGAMLQAYGLVRAVSSLGYSAKIVDYVPAALRETWWRIGLRSGMFPEIFLLRRRYHAFQREYFPLSKRCQGPAEFASSTLGYHALIVGSDQVWNAHILGAYDPVYFLDIKAEGFRRISYAACFGRPDQPQEHLAKAAGPLARFHRVSVRNPMSAALVEDIIGRPPKIVMDPTFLDDFASIDTPPPGIEGGYVLINCLRRADARHLLQIARAAAAERGLKTIVAVSTNYGTFGRGLELRRFAGPLEWLSLMKAADCVVTDSFHATVFSMKYRKPFVVSTTIPHMTHRTRGLLDRYAIGERLIAQPSEACAVLRKSLDYARVHAAIAADVQCSLQFLDESLRSGLDNFADANHRPPASPVGEPAFQ